MLSQKTIDIVKSTAPILETTGKEITTVFYKNMFEAHPELLNIFNHANQERGRQQTALANTVTAAAYYIDKLEVLLPTVKQIAQKHRSLVIKPEHYPIVGEYLLGAIKEVLGDAATDEIINAWAEAYGAIADVFISVEKEMYKQAETAPGGWSEFKEFTISDKVKESDMITSFYLKPADGKQLPEFEPGQYITVRVKVPGETYLMNRQYSLTNASNGEYFRISVKKEALAGSPEGKVSTFFHEQVEVGGTVEVTAPAGEFTLDIMNSAPVHFIAAGVGITPFMSMLHTLAKQNPNRNISLRHAAKNLQIQAFANEISSIKNMCPNMNTTFYIEDLSGEYDTTLNYMEGRLTADEWKNIDRDAVYYICGPVGFMQFVVTTLYNNGVPKENVRYEFFGPALNVEEPIQG